MRARIRARACFRRTGQPVLPRIGHAVEDGLLREDEVDGAVERVRDHLLAVVVVDLHLAECLEVLEVAGQEDDEILLESGSEGLRGGHFAPSVGKRLAGEGGAAAERLEAREHPLPRLHFEILVRRLAIHERRCVERQGRQRLPFEVRLQR